MNLQIEKLSSHNWFHFENLFLENESCSKCWCLNHRVKPEDLVEGDLAKEKMNSLIEEGKANGLIGIIKNECVAWLSVDPLSSQLGHDYSLINKNIEEHHWAIHCVYIKAKYRNLGLSKLMIQNGISYAKTQGATGIFAFPIPESNLSDFPKDEAEFSGRYSTFKKLGFVEKEILGNFYQVMNLNF